MLFTALLKFVVIFRIVHLHWNCAKNIWMQWNATHQSYSRWRTEQFDTWNVFLCQHIWELHTLKKQSVFGPPCRWFVFTINVALFFLRISFSHQNLRSLLLPGNKYDRFETSPLNSLRWFPQRRSPTPHFWGCTPEGAMSPQIRTRSRFLYSAATPRFINLCLLVRKLSCWLTNKQTPLKTSSALCCATTLCCSVQNGLTSW